MVIQLSLPGACSRAEGRSRAAALASGRRAPNLQIAGGERTGKGETGLEGERETFKNSSSTPRGGRGPKYPSDEKAKNNEVLFFKLFPHSGERNFVLFHGRKRWEKREGKVTLRKRGELNLGGPLKDEKRKKTARPPRQK